MGELDSVTKQYVCNNEVFADAFNFLFGQKIVDKDKLEPLSESEIEIYFKDGKQSDIQITRDVLKKACLMRDGKMAYAILGIENQSLVNYAMPIRILAYNAIHYYGMLSELASRNRKNKVLKRGSEFISGIKKDDKVLPVITLVIYYGSEPWDGAKCLHNMLDIEEWQKPFIPNHKINLIEPYALTNDDIEAFESSLKVVMMVARDMSDKTRLKNTVNLKKELFENIDMSSKYVIEKLTNIKLPKDEGRETYNMCKAIEDIMIDSRTEGRTEAFVEMARRMHENNMPIEIISKCTTFTVDELKEILEPAMA